MSNHTTLQHLPHVLLYDKLQPYLMGKYACGEGTVLKMRCRTGTLQVNALLHRRRQAGSPCCELCSEDENCFTFYVALPGICRAEGGYVLCSQAVVYFIGQL